MYDAEHHRAPLPRMPQIHKSDYEESSDEMPRPMIARKFKRQLPQRNNNNKQTNTKTNDKKLK